MKKILILAQVPPPFHGQSIMQKHLVDCEWDWCYKKHIRLDFSKKIKDVGKFNLAKIFSLFKVIWEVWKERLSGKIDLIYYPPCSANRIPFYRDVILLVCVRWTAKKIVFHFHAGSFDKLLDILTKPEIILARKVYTDVDLAIILYSSARMEIEWIKPNKVAVIVNGLEDHSHPKNYSSDNEKVNILYVGNLIKEKGIFDLIKACTHFKNNVNVNVVGDWDSASFKKTVVQFVQTHNLTNIVKFHGVLLGENKYHQFQNADIFCFPSYYLTEMNPLVLIEAMMFSLPIVTTRWRYLPEMIDDGVEGFLVPPKDPIALAEKLDILIADDSLRKRFGQNSRKRYVNSHLLSEHLNKIESEIKKLLEDNF